MPRVRERWVVRWKHARADATPHGACTSARASSAPLVFGITSERVFGIRRARRRHSKGTHERTLGVILDGQAFHLVSDLPRRTRSAVFSFPHRSCRRSARRCVLAPPRQNERAERLERTLPFPVTRRCLSPHPRLSDAFPRARVVPSAGDCLPLERVQIQTRKNPRVCAPCRAHPSPSCSVIPQHDDGAFLDGG